MSSVSLRTPRRGARALASAVAAALLAGLGSGAVAAPASAAGLAPFDAVDPFIGTQLDLSENKSNDAYGNTFPSGALPFGMVQPSPTTYNTDPDAHHLVREKGGYEYTADQIRGFGMTRYSGTGCHERFGGYEFPTTPYVGGLEEGVLPVSPAVDHRSYYLDFSHENEVAEPGYYSVETDNGVQTELTATTRTAVSRFAFPEGSDSATVLVDASGANNRIHDVALEIDPENQTVSGWTYGADVCDDGTHYRAYFSTTYDQPFESWGTWDGATMTAEGTGAERVTGDEGMDLRHQVGGWITFADGADVTARTGFSYVSVENAALNRQTEAADLSFDQARAQAQDAWESALGVVDVDGGSDEQRIQLYTALYHSLLHPNVHQDVNGEYRGKDGEIHTVEAGQNHYKIFAGGGWDMVRSHAQLLAMLFPEVADDITQTIVEQVQQRGAWDAFRGVDSYQNLIATLDAFGATDYDRQWVLDSIASSQGLPSNDSGRFQAFQYFATGMIENGKGGDATSRILDHAVTDFSVAQLAARLGEEDVHDTFMARAQNWRMVFDPETQEIRPRSRNSFDRGFNLAERGNQFHQSTGYQWNWHVQHNLGSLIEMRGGAQASEAVLDRLMADLDAGAYDQTGNYLSNQPALSTPWVYHWLGKPHETTDVLYRAIDEMYGTDPAGLPGNDDQGSLSSWVVFAHLGLYPAIYGTANLLVSAPMFDAITISSAGSERVYQIEAPGVSDGARYTTGLSVNGTPQTASWVGEGVARDGGTLTFEMSATPGAWGTGENDVPPSYTDGMNARNNVGTVPHGTANMGSMDLSDWAFSREGLAAVGAEQGAQLPHPDHESLVFTWPATEPGEPDNWIPHGQRIEVEPQQAATISFLGLATNGPSEAAATVIYTDGSTQDVPVFLTDWAQSPGGGNSVVVEVGNRVNRNGGQGGGTFRVFGTRPAALDPDKTVEAVTLPGADHGGLMHVFDVALSPESWTDPNAPLGDPERIVLNPSEDPSSSQYVTWRSRSQGPLTGSVEVRPAAGGETVTVAAEQKPERSVGGYPSRSHSALLNGLEPGTTYEYRVASGDRWSEWFSFTTAADSFEPYTFLYFGDAQNGIPTIFPRAIDAAVADHPDAELGLYAGDLIDHAPNDQQWTDWFDATEPLRTDRQVLTTLGNHEIGGQPFIEAFTDSFEFASNGPVPADAREYAATHGEHLAQVLQDTAYVTDYQGVRFVTLNANHDDICPISRPPGQPDDCEVNRHAWFTAQAHWLERVLQENPHQWSVVLAHQPVFSVGVSSGGLRNEVMYREHILPVLERNDVDLVLQGHDHTYGRGVHNSSTTDIDGVNAGPVYVVANAGEKMYDLPSDEDNRWTQNHADLQVRVQDVATYQSIRVEENTLTFESIATWVAPRGAGGPVAAGDVVDAFTVTRYDDGTKWVTDAGVDAPGEDEPAQNLPLPTPEEFDADTYGEVSWEDDFSEDRIEEYTVYAAGSEPAAEVAVDSESGLLTMSADDRAWTQLALPVDAAEQFALVVEPEAFLDSDVAEDSLFLGMTAGPDERVHSWYNHSRGEHGIDVRLGGGNDGLAAGPGRPYPLTWAPGDRFAIRVDHGELTVWLEQEGEWELIRRGLLDLTIDAEAYADWAPSVAVRQDGGELSLDRITLLLPSDDPDPTDPDPTDPDPTDPTDPDPTDPTDPDPTDPTDPDPTDPTDPGEQPGTEPSESDLVDELRDTIEVPATIVRGGDVTVGLAQGVAGDVTGYLFSDPVALGTRTVEDASVSFAVPSDATLGEHRLAVYDADGALIGWSQTRVIDAVGDQGPGQDEGPGLDLPSTGASIVGALGLALLLLMIGALLVLRRRRLLTTSQG
ncbi:GH92 family glycosyl hydrolase [Ruania alkalisoli]|uniref:GH92 family glycosyl hydrolase n=1 Tax=Ruania alkalisoli TaxID=2779775 RepID=UPI001B357C69|nr:GH92 family glycosyl hydrolase [Ruania alkalisoli]